MLKKLQKLYEGADLAAPNSGLMYFRIEDDCEIKAVAIYADSPVSADAVFNCQLNGTNLFSGGGKPKILSGDESGEKAGLSIDALEGDKFVLTLDSLTGTIDAPVTLILTVDDGTVSSGGSGDFFNIRPPAVPADEDDEFDADTLDAKWTVVDTGGAISQEETNGHIASAHTFRSTGGHIRFMTQPFAPGSGDFSLTMAASFAPIENYNVVGMKVSDSTEANEFEVGFVYDANPKTNSRKRISGIDTFAIGATTQNPFYLPLVFFHIQRISGVYASFVSTNGFNWQIVTNSQSLGFTVHHLSLLAGSNQGLNFPIDCAFHFIRRDWLFL